MISFNDEMIIYGSTFGIGAISSYDVILFNMFSCCTLEQMVMYIFVNFSSDQFVCDKITLLIALLTLKRVS